MTWEYVAEKAKEFIEAVERYEKIATDPHHTAQALDEAALAVVKLLGDLAYVAAVEYHSDTKIDELFELLFGTV